VRLVDALEAQGWVERLVHGDDRRAKLVRSTPSAALALDQARVIVTKMQCELFAGMDPRDLAVCARVLDELSRRLDRF
jgi:DNA-binding MarR family transcriptional regulator